MRYTTNRKILININIGINIINTTMNSNNQILRHEYKYIVSNRQADLLAFRLKTIMKKDEHTVDNDRYTIRSLYLDDTNDKLMRESINGISIRNKYRFRLYNSDVSFINLERKSTINDLKSKAKSTISTRDVNDFINRKSLIGNSELVAEIKSNGYFPKAIIEYRRIAFVNKVGNVRITFDSDITVDARVEEFLCEKINGLPVLPINRTILEVKYDSILPGYITEVLNTESLQRISYSKYVMGMNIINNNGRLG